MQHHVMLRPFMRTGLQIWVRSRNPPACCKLFWMSLKRFKWGNRTYDTPHLDLCKQSRWAPISIALSQMTNPHGAQSGQVYPQNSFSRNFQHFICKTGSAGRRWEDMKMKIIQTFMILKFSGRSFSWQHFLAHGALAASEVLQCPVA